MTMLEAVFLPHWNTELSPRIHNLPAPLERFFTVQAAPNTDLERMAAGFGEESGIRVRIHRPNDIFDTQA